MVFFLLVLLPHCFFISFKFKVLLSVTNPPIEQCRRCKSRSVVWMCQDRRHHSSLCEKHGKEARDQLKGPPGPYASTHIYDFIVRKVDFEGRIYLSNMECRRPPQQKINWKFTSRLKMSNLTAVVKVQERNSSLGMSDAIIWAEIAVHREARDEFRHREQGDMVVNDLREMKDECELRPGDNVVVIDCMTFVPEHIPVLKALDELQLSQLPFQEGTIFF